MSNEEEEKDETLSAASPFLPFPDRQKGRIIAHLPKQPSIPPFLIFSLFSQSYRFPAGPRAGGRAGTEGGRRKNRRFAKKKRRKVCQELSDSAVCLLILIGAETTSLEGKRIELSLPFFLSISNFGKSPRFFPRGGYAQLPHWVFIGFKVDHHTWEGRVPPLPTYNLVKFFPRRSFFPPLPPPQLPREICMANEPAEFKSSFFSLLLCPLSLALKPREGEKRGREDFTVGKILSLRSIPRYPKKYKFGKEKASV